MPTKTHTRNARRTGTGHTARPVPEPANEPAAVTAVRTGAEDKLWAALHANPDSTASELSKTAAIGKSTAAKILARWAVEGSVRRTPGITEGGRRAADRWSITTTGDPAKANIEVATGPPPALEPTDTDTDTAVPATVEESTACARDPEPAVDHAPADITPDTADNDDEGAKAAAARAPRLAPGGLRGLVEDFLRDHDGEEFSPNRIGKELARSSGAVHNALEKLVATGYAVQTNTAPKRYALAPTQDTPATDAPAT